MMIPNPTAASAAATVMTIKTNNCPETSRKKLEKATKVRFTALSINSMHMNIEITLRLINTPTAPMVKSTAESARYHESCGVIKRSQSLRFLVPLTSQRAERVAHPFYSLVIDQMTNIFETELPLNF